MESLVDSILNFYKQLLTNIVNRVTGTFQKEDNVEMILQVLGLCVAVYLWIYVRIFVIKLARRFFPKNLVKRYGQDSWAVVTGASDGIGKGFCDEIAKKGLNVVLIARNEEKLNKVAKEIKEINPKIQTRVVVANFSNSTTSGFFDEILKKIEDLDISLLVNNVGLGTIESFHESSENELKDLVNINVYSTMMLTRKLIDKLRGRKNKSGIINVSSSASISPMPYFAAYAGTKALIDHFSNSLQVEYSDLEILSIRPFYVSTNQTQNRPLSFDTISPNQCAKGALSDLGRGSVSYTHWKHDLLAEVMGIAPGFVKNYILKNIIMPKEMKRREEISQKQ